MAQYNIQIDHIHMVMVIPPKYAVCEVIGKIKCWTASELRKKFGWLKSRYWKENIVWSPGYFVSTVGIEEEKILIKEHGKALSFFVFLFLGITISFSLWYIFLPADLTLTLFSVQAKTISDINTQVTGQGINQMSLFSKIFFNNIKVLIFCVIFAFIYGFGAIFILTWNASVIGTAIGNFVRTNLPAPAGILSYFEITSLGILRYLIHGIPEILAYFIGGLAAGIVSIAIINHDFASKKFQHVLIDSADLLILAVAVLFVAALMEAFITPVLF